jgi:hypothetical protein
MKTKSVSVTSKKREVKVQPLSKVKRPSMPKAKIQPLPKVKAQSLSNVKRQSLSKAKVQPLPNVKRQPLLKAKVQPLPNVKRPPLSKTRIQQPFNVNPAPISAKPTTGKRTYQETIIDGLKFNSRSRAIVHLLTQTSLTQSDIAHRLGVTSACVCQLARIHRR